MIQSTQAKNLKNYNSVMIGGKKYFLYATEFQKNFDSIARMNTEFSERTTFGFFNFETGLYAGTITFQNDDIVEFENIDVKQLNKLKEKEKSND